MFNFVVATRLKRFIGNYCRAVHSYKTYEYLVYEEMLLYWENLTININIFAVTV